MTSFEKNEEIFRLSIILLASGSGQRYGKNKLMEVICGKPLFSYAVDRALQSQATKIIIVTCYPEIKRYIQKNYVADKISVIWNAHPEKGISESLRLGLMEEQRADGCCFMVCDQPLLTSKTLQRLLRSFQQDSSKIYVCSDGKRRGNPVVFPQEYYQELLCLQGDKGGKQIIKRYPDFVKEVFVENSNELWDMDFSEDRKMLENILKNKQTIDE